MTRAINHAEIEDAVDYRAKAEELERVLGEERLAFMKSVENLWAKLEDVENELAENDELLVQAWSLLEEAVRKIEPRMVDGRPSVEVDPEWGKKRAKWLESADPV